MNHLDLFSGIGGFSLGLESTGHFRTVAFCEIEDFPRRVLAKHWPDVPRCTDIHSVTRLGVTRWSARAYGYSDPLQGDIGGKIVDIPEPIDIVSGGFPCQDVSLAGARAGLSGERSGLWSELFRVITEVRPAWAIVENVPGLRTLGADAVLADLAGAGYAAWPLVVGAVHAGAPHRRQRVWIVAHAQSGGRETERQWGRPQEPWVGSVGEGRDAAHANSTGLERNARQELQGGGTGLDGSSYWQSRRAPEPVLRGVDDELPCGIHRRERLKALGNAVVPQIVAVIGKAIITAEQKSKITYKHRAII